MGKNKSLKRKVVPDKVQVEECPPPTTRSSDDPPTKKHKWINRTRVLVFATRGITHRDRHLMQDIRTLMPHSRDENKMERGSNLQVVNEMCTMKNCDKCILLEGKNKRDLYMWMSNIQSGPSVKFLIENVHTMGELKLTGNCLKGSRPLLSFDESFDATPHYALLKELLTQIFGVPNHHPKSQPFIDRVVNFTILDNRIWFRNYQILTEDGGLAEIGPRFVMNPIKIFEGSFGGKTIWENPKYITPKNYVRMLKQAASNKYVDRKDQKAAFKASEPKETYVGKKNDDIFEDNPFTKAKEIGEIVNSLKKEQEDNIKTNKQSRKKIMKQKVKPSKSKKIVAGKKEGGLVRKKRKVNQSKEKKLNNSVQNGFFVSTSSK